MITHLGRHAVGDGWELVYGTVSSPFGELSLAVGPQGLCAAAFGSSSAGALRRTWPGARWRRSPRQLRPWVRALEAGQPVPLVLRGTDFQLATWRELLAIPPGETVSYGELAARLGRPTAARAVGTAVAANGIAWAVPCHRVIHADGRTGRFRWTPRIKEALLAYEANRSPSRTAAAPSTLA
jgi:AraC family transcriptional regulator of adaptative response/methylated-DNA-[protein]-cysteine methyltransferase